MLVPSGGSRVLQPADPRGDQGCGQGVRQVAEIVPQGTGHGAPRCPPGGPQRVQPRWQPTVGPRWVSPGATTSGTKVRPSVDQGAAQGKPQTACDQGARPRCNPGGPTGRQWWTQRCGPQLQPRCRTTDEAQAAAPGGPRCDNQVDTKVQPQRVDQGAASVQTLSVGPTRWRPIGATQSCGQRSSAPGCTHQGTKGAGTERAARGTQGNPGGTKVRQTVANQVDQGAGPQVRSPPGGPRSGPRVQTTVDQGCGPTVDQVRRQAVQNTVDQGAAQLHPGCGARMTTRAATDHQVEPQVRPGRATQVRTHVRPRVDQGCTSLQNQGGPRLHPGATQVRPHGGNPGRDTSVRARDGTKGGPRRMQSGYRMLKECTEIHDVYPHHWEFDSEDFEETPGVGEPAPGMTV
eukprot:gene26994-9009_t